MANLSFYDYRRSTVYKLINQDTRMVMNSEDLPCHKHQPLLGGITGKLPHTPPSLYPGVTARLFSLFISNTRKLFSYD